MERLQTAQFRQDMTVLNSIVHIPTCHTLSCPVELTDEQMSMADLFENRAKFPLECIRAIRANMPEGMPLLMRIDAHDDYLEGGLTIEEVIKFCKLAQEAGVDVRMFPEEIFCQMD